MRLRDDRTVIVAVILRWFLLTVSFSFCFKFSRRCSGQWLSGISLVSAINGRFLAFVSFVPGNARGIEVIGSWTFARSLHRAGVDAVVGV